MGKLAKLPLAAFVYASVATILTQVLALGYLWMSGGLDEGKLFQVLAVVQDVDLAALQAQHDKTTSGDDAEQVAFEQIIQARALKNLDLDLREQSLEKGLVELRTLETELKSKGARNKALEESFKVRLAELQRENQEESMGRALDTLMQMKPKQAKDQLLIILDEDTGSEDAGGMQDVVTLVKAMPSDKLKKIVAEFRNEEETEKLAEILRQIRLGEPDSKVINDALSQIEGSKPN